MKLSTLAVGLGVLVSLPGLYGLLKPAEFTRAARRFPRSLPWGYGLMILGASWFLWNLNAESISDFAAYKKWMLLGFGTLGAATCVYVPDFLAVRGLSIVLLLVGKLMLDTARWHESQWRLFISVWAYIWIVAGMWFTISPWRLRDLILWVTANEKRIKTVCAARLVFGFFVVLLGLTVF